MTRPGTLSVDSSHYQSTTFLDNIQPYPGCCKRGQWRLLWRRTRLHLSHTMNSEATAQSQTLRSSKPQPTILRPFFRDHPGEPVPEENFWTLMCKGRLTEADAPTNHPAGRHSIRTNQCQPPPSIFLQAGCPSCHPTNSVNHWSLRTSKMKWKKLNCCKSRGHVLQCP